MIEHPRYPDGQPILLGQQVRVLDPDDQLPEVSRSGVVVEIHYVAHKDEVWVHTDTGRNVVLMAKRLERAEPQAVEHRPCPDQGRCHHECGAGPCWRVQSCGPLSGVYPGNTWPADVIEAARG